MGPDKPIVPEKLVLSLSLTVNQKVIAYQDSEQWVGTVCYDETFPDNMKWYINICGD